MAIKYEFKKVVDVDDRVLAKFGRVKLAASWLSRDKDLPDGHLDEFDLHTLHSRLTNPVNGGNNYGTNLYAGKTNPEEFEEAYAAIKSRKAERGIKPHTSSIINPFPEGWEAGPD